MQQLREKTSSAGIRLIPLPAPEAPIPDQVEGLRRKLLLGYEFREVNQQLKKQAIAHLKALVWGILFASPFIAAAVCQYLGWMDFL